MTSIKACSTQQFFMPLLLQLFFMPLLLQLFFSSFQDLGGNKKCNRSQWTSWRNLQGLRSLHWTILVLFCILFVQWSVFPLHHLLSHPKNCSFLSPLEPFWPTMTSLTESFNPSKYTPLYQNEQNERDKFQWRLLDRIKNCFIYNFQFSSIYFRNVTFYQIPPFLEFSDRFEVLFSQVTKS